MKTHIFALCCTIFLFLGCTTTRTENAQISQNIQRDTQYIYATDTTHIIYHDTIHEIKTFNVDTINNIIQVTTTKTRTTERSTDNKRQTANINKSTSTQHTTPTTKNTAPYTYKILFFLFLSLVILFSSGYLYSKSKLKS